MKKTILALLATLAIGLVAIFSIQSCSKSSDMNNQQGLQALSQANSLVTNNAIINLTTWQSKLDYVINGEGSNLLVKDGLSLISYTSDLNVNIDSVISAPVTAQTLLPIYPKSDTIQNDFIISLASEAPNMTTEKYSAKKEEMIKAAAGQNLIPVQLTWSYNGTTFHTIGLISTSAQNIVYDNILSNIRTTQIQASQNTGVIKATNNLKFTTLIKTADETTGPNGPVKYLYNSPTYTQFNWIGQEVAWASCSITVNGTRTNNVISITNHSETGTYHADPGYGASALVTIKSFATGSNGHCDYSYAVAVSDDSQLSITWDGSGYTIHGGSSGQTGGYYVAPANLN